MLMSRIKRNSPESIFGVFMNGEASLTLVDGDLVMLKTSVAAELGIAVLQTTGVDEDMLVGVVSGRDILPGQYGTIQVYGYHSNVKTVTAGTVGAPMKSSATAGSATDGAAADGPGAFLGVCIKVLAAGRSGIFIQC